MRTESIQDVLHWSTRFHTTLAYRLDKSQDYASGERERMLMNYLAEHEKLLADHYSRYQRADDMNVLKTWSHHYHQTYPKRWMRDFQEPYENMNTDEIMQDVEAQHRTVIEFYKNLKIKAEAPEVTELLELLIELEAAETCSMTEASSRLEDF